MIECQLLMCLENLLNVVVFQMRCFPPEFSQNSFESEFESHQGAGSYLSDAGFAWHGNRYDFSV